MLKKNVLGANASAKISRTEFNMGKFHALVGGELTLAIAIEAIKEQAGIGRDRREIFQE